MILHNSTQTSVREVRRSLRFEQRNTPRIEVRSTPGETAQAAAAALARYLREIATHKPRVSLAVSGGRTPVLLFEQLSRHDVPWSQIHVFQVDERCVPDDDRARNAHQLRPTSATGQLSGLAGCFALHGVSQNLHLMPVWPPDGIEGRMADYAAELTEFTEGSIDIVHLGLGDDGHTASLVPGDAVLEESSATVALTGLYQGTQRMTLTYPTLLAASELLWLATGTSKSSVISRLLAEDEAIPAGKLGRRPGTIFLDAAAAETALFGEVSLFEEGSLFGGVQ
jgi:6-phosphogluconolactonase